MNTQALNIKYIVGKQFSEFASNKKTVVLTDDLSSLLQNDQNEADHVKYIFGQGNSVSKINEILKNLKDENKKIALDGSAFEIADRSLTHKHSEKNILVSAPRKLDTDNYSANLLIDAPAELEDHVTGQHIPGMLLVEASRQMFIAVMEKFFLKKESPDKQFYFVLNSINSEFINYCFPIPAKMILNIQSFETIKPDMFLSKCKISVFQIPGRCCCKIFMEFRIINHKILAFLEKSKAFEALELNR